MYGPSGAGIWAAPTIDPKRGLIYVATGDSYTTTPTDASDALIAFDLKTGKAKPELVTIPGHPEAPPVDQDDNLKYHTDDWFQCMRNRKTTHGNIDTEVQVKLRRADRYVWTLL